VAAWRLRLTSLSLTRPLNDSSHRGRTSVVARPLTARVGDQWCRNEFESEGTGLKRKRGAPAGKFLGVVPLHFLPLKAQLVVLVSAFVMVSKVWSVSCLLFFYSRCCPRAQPFVKVGDLSPVLHGVGATVGGQICRPFLLGFETYKLNFHVIF